MSDVPEIRVMHRCETCAFRTGTPAHDDPMTQATAQLCLWSGEPFLCHEADRPALCAGFTDALARQLKGEPVPEWKQKMADVCLRTMERAEAGESVDLMEELKAVTG